MAQQVTLGGDRVGSGNKQKVELHNYGMTSFNLEQDWKSSMAPGVLYPFLKLVGTNHGTFDIDLDSFIRTLPTKGPLFGQFKFQADIFCVPIRLYQGILHNNPVGIGMKMNQVYLPKITFFTKDGKGSPKVQGSNMYNRQVNDSSLMKYLGFSGIGTSVVQNASYSIGRKINAIPFLAYYDIFKCYYSNKQEEDAYVITPGYVNPQYTSLRSAYLKDAGGGVRNILNREQPLADTIYWIQEGRIHVKMTGFNFNKNYINIDLYSRETSESQVVGFNKTLKELEDLHLIEWVRQPGSYVTGLWDAEFWYNVDEAVDPEDRASYFGIKMYPTATSSQETDIYTSTIKLQKFALQNIDDMRNKILSCNTIDTELSIENSSEDGETWGTNSGTDGTGLPYSALIKETTVGITWNAFEMNGLCVKTYQSDLFNNWLDTEIIDGENGISALTAVTVSNGSFTIDSLNLAEKIYEVLNRVAVSGGTYEDWQEAVYGEGAVRKAETPMYMGGLSAEIMFEEVISTAETDIAAGEGLQALGSLGGKGTTVGQHGGHNIHIKCEEPCYIIGICSITPRICYSQGNDWDLTELDTLDDLHKPALDGIGFQDLMIEQMAWWDTSIVNNSTTIAHRSSAGKQTAWINYQTAVDKCYGDFAKQEGNAFMVLNRNYERIDEWRSDVGDITTYIDPTKYNYAFAYIELAAQNFWVQVHSKVIARRKMGAQQIPNL